MSDREAKERGMHTSAILAARKAAGLSLVPEGMSLGAAEEVVRWCEEGPHLEVDGRSYFVHAFGCQQWRLGRMMEEHPDWYLVMAESRHGRADDTEWRVWGLDENERVTLQELREEWEHLLSPDELRLAFELTNREKRKLLSATWEERSADA